MLAYTVEAYQRYLQTQAHHPDWRLISPKFYVNRTRPRVNPVETLAGIYYVPADFSGTFLMVYPADTDAWGNPYYSYLPAHYTPSTGANFWAHDECRRLTTLHRMGFHRIAADALPPDLLQSFAPYWRAFLTDLTPALSA